MPFPGIRIGWWLGLDGVPWDVVLLPLAAAGRTHPALLLRPRPVPQPDQAKLAEAFGDWKRRMRTVRGKGRSIPPLHRATWAAAWHDQNGHQWPSLSYAWTNTTDAVAATDKLIDCGAENITGRVVGQAPWLFCQSARLRKLANAEMNLPDSTPRAIQAALRIQVEAMEVWPSKVVCFSPGPNSVTVKRAMALTILRELFPGELRAVACFASGHANDDLPESRCVAIGLSADFYEALAAPSRLPQLVPLLGCVLAESESPGPMRLLDWLFGETAVETLKELFGNQVNALGFWSSLAMPGPPARRVWRGLPMLSLGSRAHLDLIESESEESGTPYIGWRLHFRHPDGRGERWREP